MFVYEINHFMLLKYANNFIKTQIYIKFYLYYGINTLIAAPLIINLENGEKFLLLKNSRCHLAFWNKVM